SSMEVVNRTSIQQKIDSPVAAAVQLDGLLSERRTDGSADGVNARDEPDQVDDIASAERQVAHSPVVDQHAMDGGAGVHLRGFAADRHRFGDFSHLEMKVSAQALQRAELHILLFGGPESALSYPDVVHSHW